MKDLPLSKVDQFLEDALMHFLVREVDIRFGKTRIGILTG
jgi:hypothetical protein